MSSNFSIQALFSVKKSSEVKILVYPNKASYESVGYLEKKNLDLTPLSLDSEISLINNLMEFPTIIIKAHENLEPQTIANYLYGLANQFHRYYANERIVTENKKLTTARLSMIKAIKIVLYNGLSILGINAPARM